MGCRVIAPRSMKRRLGCTLMILAALTICASCARVPSNSRSASILKSHFKKYGKKYPATPYGQHKVTDVEVSSQSEIHKGMVAVEAFVTFDDGNLQRVYATLERGPVGWRFVSWEIENNE